MEHPITVIMRWYLLAMLGLLSAWLWPEFGLLLLGTSCFGWWPGDGCCANNPCTNCTSGTNPTQIQIDMSGVTNILCADCASMNVTFIFDQWDVFFSTTGHPCIYVVQFTAVCITYTQMEIDLLANDIHLTLPNAAAGAFDKAPGATYDCGTTYNSFTWSGSDDLKCTFALAAITYTGLTPLF